MYFVFYVFFCNPSNVSFSPWGFQLHISVQRNVPCSFVLLFMLVAIEPDTSKYVCVLYNCPVIIGNCLKLKIQTLVMVIISQHSVQPDTLRINGLKATHALHSYRIVSSTLIQ